MERSSRRFRAARRQHSALQGYNTSSLQASTLLELTALVTRLMQIQHHHTLIDEFTSGIQAALQVDAVLTWMHNPASHRYVLSSIACGAKQIEAEDRSLLGSLQVRTGEALVGKVVSDGVGRVLPSASAYRAEFGMLGRRREALFGRLRAYLPDDFRSLAVPMLLDDHTRPLGVVELMTARSTPRSHDLLPLRQYFNQIGSLLHFVQVQEEAHKQRQRLSALDAVVTAISTASDLPELLQMALLVMIEVMHASGGAICLTAPGQQAVQLAAQHELPAGEAALINSSEAILLLEDVVYYGQPSLRPVLESSAPHAGGHVLGRAAVPLMAGGTIVGVLLLYGTLEQLTAYLDWPALVSVSSQIAIAIANTRLYEESQRERQRLGTVIASIADGVAICDGSGQLILANEAAATLLGLASLPELSRDYHARTVWGEAVPVDQLPLARALAGEVFQDYQVMMRGANAKDMILSFSGAPLRGSSLSPEPAPQFDGAVVVFRDITEQRRLDEAKDEFLAIAAHELRSPLSAIKGYSDLLLRRELRQGGDERDLKGHRILNQQVNVLVQLVDNLLDISRIDAGRFVLDAGVVQMNELVEGVVTQIDTTAKHHTIQLEKSAEPAAVWGDQLRLRQVLTNLLTNAVRYSPTNSRVWVAVLTDQRTVRVCFDDEGPGIPPDERERLFERYYRVPGIKRTGSSTEGLGLGLYLCREIITLHEGRIWVEQSPSGGARFQIELRRLKPNVAENEAILDAAIDRMLTGSHL